MENEIYSQKLDLHGIPGVGMIQSALLQKNMADSFSSVAKLLRASPWERKISNSFTNNRSKMFD